MAVTISLVVIKDQVIATKNYTPWLLVRKGTIPTERPPRHVSAKLVPTFADRRCRVVRATDPHDR
jgi:hypothetical protein